MEYESLINYPATINYIRALIPKRQGFLGVLEQECREEGLPIIKPEAAQLLETLCTLQKPKKILEIGTCVGFSALLMKSASIDIEKIVTIDRYKYMIDKAKQNLEQFDKEHIITLLEGQASEILPHLDEEFDLIFLDAAKGQYPTFLPHCIRLLKTGGVFIADNVLFDGVTAQPQRASRRDKTIARRLDDFLTRVLNHPSLKTSLLPIGDGMTMSIKILKEDEQNRE